LEPPRAKTAAVMFDFNFAPLETFSPARYQSLVSCGRAFESWRDSRPAERVVARDLGNQLLRAVLGEIELVSSGAGPAPDFSPEATAESAAPGALGGCQPLSIRLQPCFLLIWVGHRILAGESCMVGVSRHTTAEVHSTAVLGAGTMVWAWSQIRENAAIGSDTSIGQGCYVGPGLVIGDCCKIQNSALIYEPAVIGDSVFIGPGAVLTNDRFPRAVNVDGSRKKPGDWEPVGVTIGRGVAIGARAVLVGPVTIGEWATVGAGAVVSSDVKAFALIVGNPGRQIGWVGRSGVRLTEGVGCWVCPNSGEVYSEDNGVLTPNAPTGGMGA
jgi:acetyltransferase-like isoleucine patch superfamily enzyme